MLPGAQHGLTRVSGGRFDTLAWLSGTRPRLAGEIVLTLMPSLVTFAYALGPGACFPHAVTASTFPPPVR